ncbi:hypothetical protein ZIOFF_049911 [Zingiber officinale]|uniref:Uncharacterized protein n=1 Tax=Zingiber officinale TaxID=94328 RepID=A0A8J5FI15_ZINOF|nr:hypothetical protein ZIOFF_049911 [Zingiber officinale]
MYGMTTSRNTAVIRTCSSLPVDYVALSDWLKCIAIYCIKNNSMTVMAILGPSDLVDDVTGSLKLL